MGYHYPWLCLVLFLDTDVKTVNWSGVSLVRLPGMKALLVKVSTKVAHLI